MKIGIPKEIKPLEARVALIPEAAGELVRAGHTVLIEHSAGLGSGFADAMYEQFGVIIQPDAASLYREAEMIVKVKEPVGRELELLQERHRLFSFLHLAANPELTQKLQNIGLTAVAFETVLENGQLPLLAPMSAIAGRVAVQVGTHLLHQTLSGKGILLGGVPGAARGHTVVLGAGNAGSNAIRLAAAIGSKVTVFDRNPTKHSDIHNLPANITLRYPHADLIEQAVKEADLLIGAVLIPGAVAPRLVSRRQIATMQPGSVVVDISVDQGGCIETTRPTSYEDPTYLEEGVVHFTVTNMPGAVPRTASEALSAALMPYVERLTSPDWLNDPALAAGVNVRDGRVVHPALL